MGTADGNSLFLKAKRIRTLMHLIHIEHIVVWCQNTMLTIRQEQGIQDIDRLCHTCHAHIPGIAVEDVERQCSCNGITHRTLLIQRRARIKCTAVPVAPLADNQFTFSRRCLERAFRFWKRFKPGVDQAALFVDDIFQLFASVDDIIPLFLIKFLLGLKLLQILLLQLIR